MAASTLRWCASHLGCEDKATNTLEEYERLRRRATPLVLVLEGAPLPREAWRQCTVHVTSRRRLLHLALG